MDRYFEARALEAAQLRQAHALPSTTIGREYSKFIQNAYLADNPYLIRAYLRVLAQRPWWANQEQWEPPEISSQNIVRATQLVEKRVDHALEEMIAARDSGYSVPAATDVAITAVIALPVYDATSKKYVLQHEERERTELEERHAQEDMEEAEEDQLGRMQAQITRLNDARDLYESDPELEDAD